MKTYSQRKIEEWKRKIWCCKKKKVTPPATGNIVLPIVSLLSEDGFYIYNSCVFLYEPPDPIEVDFSISVNGGLDINDIVITRISGPDGVLTNNGDGSYTFSVEPPPDPGSTVNLSTVFEASHPTYGVLGTISVSIVVDTYTCE